MNFIGKAKRLDDIDLPMIGREIGVGEDEVHAILDVESAGTGFDAKGRPKMLFEPHIFWRELGPGPKRDAAFAAGLAYPKWKRDYPNDSYPRLLKAMAIDENAAMRSASWGLGQIMGFNCKMAGYPTAEGMAMHFLDDEERHLRAMIRFIVSAGLDDELRRHDWAGFARGYNGAGFAKNGYDKKLAASFAKWQKIKDTPLTRPAPHVIETPKIEHVQKRTDQNPIKKPVPPGEPQESANGSGGGGNLVLLAFGGIGVAVVAGWDTVVAWWDAAMTAVGL